MTTMKTPGMDTMDTRMDHLKDSVREFVHTGQDKVSDIADKAKVMSDQARETGMRALGRTRDLIKLHPIASVAIAFGVGYLVMRVARFV